MTGNLSLCPDLMMFKTTTNPNLLVNPTQTSKVGRFANKNSSIAPAKLKGDLDDELLNITLAQKINRKKDGYRRQLSFIGKLLRQRDILQR